MSKIIRNIAMLLPLALSAFAQTATYQVTLSAPVGRGDTTLTLSSNPSSSIQVAGLQPLTGLYIDREYMTIVSNVNSTNPGNTWNVKRGVAGIQTPHNASSVVFVGPTGNAGVPFDLGVNDRAGACTRAAFQFLPIVEVKTGHIANCIAGNWVTGIAPGNATAPYTFFTTISPPNPITTSSVADVAGKLWYSQLNIPQNAILTGACVMNGITVGTDKWIFALYDSSGALLANTATAGATTATASKYQCLAFTSTIQVSGPQTYYIAVQGNGTTDNFQAYAANGAPTGYGTGSLAGTFGTLPSITPPTTFTAANGPLMMVY